MMSDSINVKLFSWLITLECLSASIVLGQFYFMAEIIVQTKRYGKKIILLDDADYEILKGYSLVRGKGLQK